jgi:hypothetical protein
MTAQSRWDLPVEHDVRFEPNVTLDVVEVWRDGRDLLWRWRYRGHDGTDLMAHRSFPTRESAVEAAGVAYPGVMIRDRVEAPKRPSHPARTAVVVLVVLAVVATGGLALLAVGALLGATVAVRAARRNRSRGGG